MKQNIRYTLISLLALYTLGSCRDDVEMILSEDEYTGYTRTPDGYRGFYLLNEGNMGSNKSTLDYYDFTTGIYTRNIYAEVNPPFPRNWAMWATTSASTEARCMPSSTAPTKWR